jgi:hypothetical protein
MNFVLGSRNGRVTRWLAALVAIGVSVALSSACGSSGPTSSAAQAAGSLTISPASGPTSSTPTWATSVACPSGYQGSAVFSELHADGKTYTTIAPIVNGTNVPFKGTLLASIARIQFFSGGVPDGGTQELFVQCTSGPGGTGNTQNDMKIYITYSSDGTSYTTSATS